MIQAVEDKIKVEQLRQATGYRLTLQRWELHSETIKSILISDTAAMVAIEAWEVKSLVREDRYDKHGTRVLAFEHGAQGWHLLTETEIWDDDFEPFIHEKIGRRKTAEEMIEQREWEKMCHRPGNGRFPLDSYERVCDTVIRSTDKMERHF